MQDFPTSWRRSVVGELCWLTADGPKGVPVVPLDLDGQPCVALPLAHLAEVDSLPGRAAFCVTAQGVTDPGRPGAVAVGPIEVSMDATGSQFNGDLVEQEIVKHPPTRLRAGSLMARGENWWWLPRAIITLGTVEKVHEVGPRADANHGLLVRERDYDVDVSVVTAAGWAGGPGSPVELWARGGAEPEGRGEPALVFGHQASPDFEKWERWSRAGTLHGQDLALTRAEGAPEADPRPFRLLERLRNHWQVERACRRGIAAVERRQSH